MINWQYADKFGSLPNGPAEQVEALVQIAEQLDRLNDNLDAQREAELWKVKD